MRVWLTKFWEALRANYWFVPSLLVIAAAALAVSAIAVDRTLISEEIELPEWVYAGGTEGARSVLSAIVGAMMSVTSIVFSITIVALTLASSQFGPRLLRNFMRDRGSQFTLGIFVATFVYSLLVLRTIRGGEEAFVPQIAATGALILAILCTGVLIYFIHHISEMIQADQVISAVDDELRKTIDRLFPPVDFDEEEDRLESELPDNFEDKRGTVTIPRGGYLQGIDLDGAAEIATKYDLIFRFPRRPGDFVADEDPIVEVYPSLPEDLARRIRLLVVTGNARTPTQDVEYGILQLAEVAVRSLSPGINDPFTAIACIDRLGSALRRLADRPELASQRHDDDGNLRVNYRVTTFGSHVGASFHQIRQNARDSTAIYARLLEALICVATATDDPKRRETLHLHGQMILETANRKLEQSQDRADIEKRHRKLEKALSDS